jgi:hypothetical protein
MTDTDVVAAIYTYGGIAFIVLIVVGAITTVARVLFYARNNAPRPRLLTRDVIVIGGLAWSFSLIVAVRFLPSEQRVAFTTGNIAWALVTTLPALIAATTYVYFELFVVKRGIGR